LCKGMIRGKKKKTERKESIRTNRGTEKADRRKEEDNKGDKNVLERPWSVRETARRLGDGSRCPKRIWKRSTADKSQKNTATETKGVGGRKRGMLCAGGKNAGETKQIHVTNRGQGPVGRKVKRIRKDHEKRTVQSRGGAN